MPNHFTLLEHKFLFVSDKGKEGIDSDGNIGLSQKTFEEIEAFVLQNSNEATSFLRPDYKKTKGRTLKAQQYVGVLETKNGTVIEILPKIAKQTEDKEIRKTFLKMLKTLKKSPFKHCNQAHLKSEKMHLLEIFISMFCEELAVLVRKGIKSDYIAQEENAKFLKGRLMMSQHITKNMVHKERFYVEFDEYSSNRVENRLIKSTLQFLYNKSQSNQNKKRLREFLFTFEDIDTVNDSKTAFAKVKLDRQMKDYALVLQWARLFLQQESFSSFKGNSLAFALLFDMNRVFEDYVAHCLKRDYPECEIQTQVNTEHLLESPRREFKLKPDLKVKGNIIADTKWKVLGNGRHHGISQSDIYQMYAYGKKYEYTKKIFLIYPWVEGFPELEAFMFDKTLILEVLAFDCNNGEFRKKNVNICLIQKGDK